MYNDIGKQIKKLTKFMTVLFIVISVIVGFVFFALKQYLFGVEFILVMPILLCINSLIMYGFGELIDKVCDIERNTRNDSGDRNESTSQLKQEDKVKKLDELRTEGLISEEEYRDKISKEETL